MSNEVIDNEGRNKINGRFEAGNVVARRKKGKRHKINQAMLDHIEKRGTEGKYFFEALTELADNTNDENLRFKCEAQIGNWFMNPQAQIVIKDDEDTSDEGIKTQILALIGGGAQIVTIDDEDEEEVVTESE